MVLTIGVSIAHVQADDLGTSSNDKASPFSQLGEGDQHQFLPAILWTVPAEEEPNDNFGEANPIEPGLMYWGRFESSKDANDYFYFELKTSARVKISLTSIPVGHDYTLVLREANLTFIAQSANPDNANERIEILLPPGTYYVQVFNASMTGTTEYYKMLLTIEEILVIADFNTCDSPNNLGGGMGTACPLSGCPPPNSLEESYVVQEPGNCIACLEYHILDWSAFWMKLAHADMMPFTYLGFDIRGEGDVLDGNQLKIEIKRDCHPVAGGTECNEISIRHVGGITSEWQHRIVPLSAFIGTGWPGVDPIQDWSDIEELVFTFEASQSGRNGFVYLDNIRLEN
jgi:hypothetical protein